MSAEVEVKRGEIWWVNGGYAPGSTEMVGRPAVTVSNVLFGGSVIVAYATSSSRAHPMQPCVQYGGEKRWVLCNQTATIQTEQLDRKIAELSDQEMSKVSKALRMVLDLEEKKSTEDTVALKVECEMYKKLYEAAMNRIVDMRLENDLKAAHVAPAPVVVEVAPAPEEEKGPVELNTCTVEELKELGFWHRQAIDIIEARPFRTVEELAEVSDIPPWLYASVKSRVCVAPEPDPEPEHREDGLVIYDLNSVSADDLNKRLGFKPAVAEAIVAARPFKKVEDLVAVPGVTRLAYQLVNSRLTVNPVVAAEEPKVLDMPPKVNVNTATAKEIAEALGVHVTTGYAISGYRKKYGPFRSIDDLMNVDRISKTFLLKHGSKLEV